ncbi:MAG: hypothetical protein JO235_23285, partial [Chroococcidiopsidaceae cyanobacterium CP_BM_RX_35]|nr:hypothetical protein [Chroococcidiopsidaceae cyanobacterium CP_BM_RX_35]
MLDDFDPNDLDFNSFSQKGEHETELNLTPHHNPFEISRAASPAERTTEATGLDAFANPFTSDSPQPEVNLGETAHSNPFEDSVLHVEQVPGETLWNRTEEPELGHHPHTPLADSQHHIQEQETSAIEAFELPQQPALDQNLQFNTAEDETLLLGRKPQEESYNLNGLRELDFDLDALEANFGLAGTSRVENEFDISSHTLDRVEPSTGSANFVAPIQTFEALPDSKAADSTNSATNNNVLVAPSTVETPNPSIQPSRAVPHPATWETRQLKTAGAVGLISAVVVAACSLTAALMVPQPSRAAVRTTGGVMAVAALIASGGASLLLGRKTSKQLQKTATDLRNQFEAVRLGNLNAKATVYSEDEFGLLASEFNEMSRVVFATIKETQRKAEEQERAKEDLQRQVIRLLDDVEGAARGDLTVEATVSADVLGAVADSFNLTIHNLREIVQQVKLAARQVSQGAVDSETFARALSSDALRQAEELAVTLNSVQVMTDAIQRVAESAREAEAVARSASATAKKGGDAVERTVAGILEIRQTVAQTTRKVKRLAESSQEISKIVALISQIASRTNLLALNASIEAARAGESGRGFAIVADEVRQLADRVAKALKEIEQIVRQIQSETGSVMTAMEEGTQQVIQGTHLAEQAKRSLEDIVQVSNRIDTLVRSITADTVEQTESSRAVAAVMQSVELTAQETSQEAQRVSGSLQSFASVAGSLLSSVERFKVET